MATIEHVTYEDDIDGTDAAERVHFMLDGVDYEMDLNAEHAAELRQILGEYAEHARRTGGRTIARRTVPTGGRRADVAPAEKSTRARSDRAKLIREWADKNGIKVHAIGRISKPVEEAYAAAHPEPATGRGRKGGA